jgi:hypothetical protein
MSFRHLGGEAIRFSLAKRNRPMTRRRKSRPSPIGFELLEERLAPATQLISSGIPFANESSFAPSISADGRFVAFDSGADNLVAGDTNGAYDVFLRNTQTGATIRVSTSSNGSQGEDFYDSAHPAVSADGRYVAFYSEAPNLVPGDTNNLGDIFVKDTLTGTTTRVNTTQLELQSNNFADLPSAISADGRYVTFVSLASNLVENDTNLRQDVFLKNTFTGQVRRVSSNSAGGQVNNISNGPSMSADGLYVAFYSAASNVVPDDTNDFPDIFVKNRVTGETTLVSVTPEGGLANNGSSFPSISADGRHIAYVSLASNLAAGDTNNAYDVFVTDLDTMTTSLVSANAAGVVGNDNSGQQPGQVSISGDGRYVAFWSGATNLVPGDTNGVADIFVKDTLTGMIKLVSADSAGVSGNATSIESAISADGRYVAFTSNSSNMVPGDSNGFQDIFLASLGVATTTSLVATPLATTGGTAVMFAATVQPSPGDLGTVTFVDDDSPMPGGVNVPLVGGVAAFSTTALAEGSHPVTASYNGVLGFYPSASTAQTVTIGPAGATAPKVLSITINGGTPSLPATQRSRIANLTVVFDQPVALDAGAMALALHTHNVILNGQSLPNGFGSLPTDLAITTTDNITWTVKFSGNTDNGADGLNSIRDGLYDFTIDADKVHVAGTPNVTMAADSSMTFHRLFGDNDVPETPAGGVQGVDFQSIVNSGDNLGFRTAFNNLTNYVAFFDFDGDGIINTGDNLEFRNRFNRLLKWTA